MDNQSNQAYMDDHTLLAEMLRTEKRVLRHARIANLISLVLVVVLLGSLLAVVLRVGGMAKQAQEALKNFDTFVETAEQAQDTLEDMDSFIRNANRLLTDNMDELTEAVGKLNSLDIDTLNQAIQNLYNVITPLANFFGQFR